MLQSSPTLMQIDYFINYLTQRSYEKKTNLRTRDAFSLA